MHILFRAYKCYFLLTSTTEDILHYITLQTPGYKPVLVRPCEQGPSSAPFHDKPSPKSALCAPRSRFRPDNVARLRPSHRARVRNPLILASPRRRCSSHIIPVASAKTHWRYVPTAARSLTRSINNPRTASFPVPRPLFRSTPACDSSPVCAGQAHENTARSSPSGEMLAAHPGN